MNYSKKLFINIFVFISFIGSAYSQSTDITYVLLSTDYGNIKIELFNDTPLHKENFLKLTREGFYDSLLFHRVINGFMIQGGDPDSRNAKPGIPLGTGDPGYTIPAEFVKSHFHQKGALAAARQGDRTNPEKKSSGSQFYIVQGKKYTEEELSVDTKKLQQYFSRFLSLPENATLKKSIIQLQRERKFEELNTILAQYKPTVESYYDISFDKPFPADRLKAYTTVGGTPHLDDGYTVFGQVVEGLDIIDKIANLETDSRNRPLKDAVFSIKVIQ